MIKKGKGFASLTMNLSKWILLAVLVLGCLVLYKTVLSPHESITLSWTAPTEYENNEPLTDLAGYIIHCWTETGQYTNTIYVNDPSITSYEIEKLWPGTYSCAVAAIDEDGDESALSNVVAKSVR